MYSEHLFLEHVYGSGRYQAEVGANFLNVLENTHVQEDGYRAVSGIPHELTYGRHVYNKGAVVAHNLRGYLGDSLFRVGLRAVLEENAFADWSSAVFATNSVQPRTTTSPIFLPTGFFSRVLHIFPLTH